MGYLALNQQLAGNIGLESLSPPGTIIFLYLQSILSMILSTGE